MLGGGKDGTGSRRADGWAATQQLLLGEQRDTEAGSKLTIVQRKINTVELKLLASLDLVCSFKPV